MKISVIGLGKLGFPMASLLSSKFEINGYDKNLRDYKSFNTFTI